MDLRLVNEVPDDLAIALDCGKAKDAFLSLPETTRRNCIQWLDESPATTRRHFRIDVLLMCIEGPAFIA